MIELGVDKFPLVTVPMVQLIGISGKAGSGKDAVATYLREHYDCTYIYPFASQLKVAAAVMFGIPLEYFHSRDLKEVAHNYWGVSPRQVAQFLGTESVRIGFQTLLGPKAQDFWIHRLCEHINYGLEYRTDDYERGGQIEPGDSIVIPDVRFQNEYDWILLNGGIVIQLSRPGADGNVGIAGHASEIGYTSVDTERTFQCVNDGTLEELYAKVDVIMKSTEPTVDSLGL